MAVRCGRTVLVTAALAVSGAAVALAPPAQAAVVASLTGDMGCSPSTLGRPLDPRPVTHVLLTGSVTGLTPGTYYYLQVPNSVGETAGGAPLGTADAAGTVRIVDVDLGLSPSQATPTPIPYGIFSGNGGPGTRVTHGTVPLHIRSVAGCSSLSRLVSGPFSSTVVTYGLNLQPDRNVVERTVNYGKTLWTTGTVGHPGARAVLQSDGNVVVRDTAGRALWTSGTAGHPGATLTVQSDSNVVLRDGAGRAVWSTGIHR